MSDLEKKTATEEITDTAATPVGKPDRLMEFLDWLKTLLIILLIGVLLTVFVIQRNSVHGTSMEPTLHHKDQIFVEKVSKLFDGGIDRGDIITLDTAKLKEESGNLVIKRVIGLPGETVDIRDGRVYINGEPLPEPYLDAGVQTFTNPQLSVNHCELGDDEYFVLGDNRGGSSDSRRYGAVPKDHIIGKLLFRFYPFSDFGKPE